jgi:hypothetical protein
MRAQEAISRIDNDGSPPKSPLQRPDKATY